MVIYHKKLDSGRFKLPQIDENTHSLTLDWKELIMMIQQITQKRKKLQKK
jgi:hypothetical protein